MRALSTLLATLALAAATAGAQVSTTTLRGELRSLWVDPPTGKGIPHRIHTLVDDAGHSHELTVDEAVLRAAGGAERLEGRRVELTISAASASIAERAAPGAEAVVVHAITTTGLQPRAPSPIRTPTGARAVVTTLATAARPFAVLLCKFADSPTVEPAAKSHYERYVTGQSFPSTNHYWTEVSNGTITLDGSAVYGWYVLPNPREYYVNAGTGSGNAGRLAVDCAAAADADVNLPSYDGVAFQFNQSLGNESFAGGVTLEQDGVRKSYKAVWMSDWATGGAGAYAHEIGHTLGLSHSTGPYGTTYDSRWDVMSDAMWWTNGPVNIGAHTLAIQKDRLGLVPAARKVEVVDGEQTLLLERSALPNANANALLVTIPIPGTAGTVEDYYTVEARRHAGYDAGLPEGVVIHRVGNGQQVRVVDADGNGNPNDAGATWVVGETFRDPVNGISVRIDDQVGDAYRITVHGAAPQPRIAIAPAPRSRTIAFGTGGARGDSASIVVTGADASTLTWHVLPRGRRLVPLASSGTGSGMLRWIDQQSGLGAGMHVDTLVILADGALGSPLRLVDTLVVTAPPALAIGFDASVRIDSLMPGATSSHVVTVLPSGPAAESAPWTATTRASWIVFDSTAGTGQGELSWRHDGRALAPGVYVDSIVVSTPGASPARLVDSLRVLTPPVIIIGRTSGSRRVPFASAAVVDSFAVTLSGADAAGLRWQVGTGGAVRYLAPQFSPTPNVGSGWVRLRWDPAAIAPGVYVNTATIRAAMGGSAVTYTDTLYIDAAPSAIVLSAESRHDSVVASSYWSVDSVWVQPQGDGGPNRAWAATANPNRTFFLARSSLPQATGIGPSWLVWTRNSGEGAGVYVDTIVVSLTDTPHSTVRLVDSLTVIGAPTLAVGTISRSSLSMLGRETTSTDSATVNVSGYSTDGASWSASARAPWLTITTASGVGSGMLRWTRTATGLAAGTHVDTITVAATGLMNSPHRIVDSLRVLPSLVVTTDLGAHGAVMGAAYADTLRAAGGIEERRWDVVTGALPRGIALDSMSGALRGVPEQTGEFRFTARVRSAGFPSTRDYSLVVTAPAIAAGAILDQLLSVGQLTPDQLRYLDLLGNRNARLDVGDVRAWLQTSQATATAEARALAAILARPDSAKR